MSGQRSEEPHAGAARFARRHLRVVVAALAILTACDGDVEPADGGLDAGGPECSTAADCDDGVFCTGPEACVPGAEGADARGCVREPACATTEACDEEAGRCVPPGCESADDDGDGHRAVACGGIDCDDEDPLRYPGASELCETADRDEDRDPITFGYRDADGDGYADAACCNEDDAGELRCGDDCNDGSTAVHPALADSCDARDNDCDGAIDEDGSVLYLDCDGDGFGNSAVFRMGCPEAVVASDACPAPLPSSTWTSQPGDCDDARASTNPGATETCNGVDDDCVLPLDPPECTCTVGQTTVCGYDASCETVSGGCVSGVFACPPGLRTGAEAEICNGVDDNCDGGVDEGCPCRPVGETRSCARDGRTGVCAEGNESCAPSGWSGCAEPTGETCDGANQDCDARVDEGMHVWQVAISSPCSASALARSHLCAQLIANECASRAGPGGQCAGRNGFGHVEATGGLIDVVCTDLVAERFVSGAALRTHHDGCSSAPVGGDPDGGYSACRAAINRYCAARGGPGGYGWVDGSDTWSVQCFSATQGTAFAVTWSALAAYQPACNSFPASHIYCPPAVHDECIARGFVAGYGPVEQSPAGVTILCVRDF